MKRQIAVWLIVWIILIVSIHIVPVSDGSYPRTDSSSDVDRTVLVECFTGTWCSPCQGPEGVLDQLAGEYPRTLLTIIEWHNGDDYVTVDNSGPEREDFYKISGYPTTYFDGVERVESGSSDPNDEDVYDNFKNQIENRLNIASPLTIKTGGYIQGNKAIVGAEITAVESIALTDLYVHFVLYYDHNETFVVDDREYRLRYTGLKSLISSISIEKGETIALHKEFDLESDWDMEKLGVVTFVQTHNKENYTAEVLQSNDLRYPIQPIATITANKTMVDISEEIMFDSALYGLYYINWSNVGYCFDFDNGNLSNWSSSRFAYYHYSNPGTYFVKVKGKLGDGNETDWSTPVSIFVDNITPTAVLTSNITYVLTYESVEFCMSESFDLDGYIAEYFLDFGDETNISLTSAENITHYYTDNGYYTVTLHVWDDDYLTSQTSIHIYVANRPPTASISANPVVVEIGSPITFSGLNSYDLDGNITQYYFDFGDGTNSGWTTDYSKSHLYMTSGVYNATLRVKDDDGSVSSIAYIMVIVGQPSTPDNQLPVVYASLDTTVYVDEPVLFNGSANDADGFIIYYQWDFDGDGKYDWNSTNTGVTTYAYAINGTYYAKLRVYDNQGGFSTGTRKIIVKEGHAQTITPSGGILEYNNIVIIVPEGATTQNVTFTVTKIPTANPSGYIIIGEICRIETDVTGFTQPMTLILSYNESNLPANISEDDLAIYKKVGDSWVKLDSTVDKINNTVSTVVTGFSEYAILYKKASAGNPLSEIPWLYIIILVIIIIALIGVGLGIKKKTAGKTKKNTMKIRCPSCKTMFEVEEQERPFRIKCPKCGKEGMIK